jgi:hypothetical protein
VGVTHTVCPSRASYCNPRNVRHIFLPSLSHATITKHARHDHKTCHLGLCMLQFATFTTPNCMCCYRGVHRIAPDCVYNCVCSRTPFTRTCCALRTLLKRPNARKRVCTRSRTSNACDRTPTRRLGSVHVAIGDMHNPKSLHTSGRVQRMRTHAIARQVGLGARWRSCELNLASIGAHSMRALARVGGLHE